MPSRPQIFQPHSRAEAAAPLTAVEEACKADAGYLASVARIIADVLTAANSVTEAPVPGESTEARALRMQTRIMNQISHRGAA